VSTDIPLLYWLHLDGRTFEVNEARGREALSRPFRIEVRFILPDGAPLRPASVVQTEASLTLRREADDRTISGIVTDVKVRAARHGAPEVTLVLEPRLSLARYRSDIRIFREKTAVEIVCEVLQAIGVRPELRLSEVYDRRHYCVQFRETDLDFVSRLLEDEGISYFFLEGDVMVLMDRATAYEPIPGDPVVPFVVGSGLDRNLDSVTGVARRAALVPSKVTLRDFNPERPRLDMDVVAPVASPSGAEWYDFPGEYERPAQGARKAQLMSEAFACASGGIGGTSFCGRLLPGCRLKIIDGPEPVPDGDYVITALEHAYRRDADGFSSRFEALEGDVTYRPPRATYEPRLLNPVTGFVTGPAGDDIYTDAWGRVKVHFHWDRKQPFDEECSYWIPVLQDNTGSSCGVPRIGWEVLVHFLEGDPDRPVVLGRVYNAEDEFPQKLPFHKTRSALRSQSSPARKGTNEIRFEDLAGAEHIYVYAERDQNVVIANDRQELVTNNEAHVIERDERLTIGSDNSVKVTGNIQEEVGGDQTWSVGGSRRRQTGKADAARVEGSRTLSVGSAHKRRIGTHDMVAAENLKETVGGVILEASSKSNYTQGEKGASLTVGGAVIEIAKQDKSETANVSRIETVGVLSMTTAGKEIATRVSTTRRTKVGIALKVKAKEQIAVAGVEELSMKAAKHAVDGSASITLKVGETTVVMKGSAIEVTATSVIKMIVDGENKQGAGNSTQI